MLAGAIATVGLYTVGWTLFGLAALRARAFPRAAALLLLVGGLAGPLALSTPYQIPLAIAIGWIGLTLQPESRGPRTPPPAVPAARDPSRSATQSRGTAMKRSRLLAIRLLVAVACGIASAVLGSTSAAADDGPDLAAIDRYVRSEMDAQRIPGLALGIVHGDRIVHVQGFGQADRSGRSVTPQTPFLIGSVTKSFTALAIMQLSEAGRMQLDAPVQRYLPWWRVADPDASTRVTVRHLLYQVSGLSKATGNAYATSGDTHDSALEDRVRALRDAELTQPVGTTWQYSNANYWTLGMIVQAVSGQSYETYIQQHIFDPLQMRSSYTSRTEAEQHGLPTGHRYWYGFPVASELPFDRGGLGSGGLSSSAQDMTRYLSLYLNEGRHGATALVSPAGAAELQRAGVPTGLDGVSYAMGWDVGQIHGIHDDLPRRQRLRLPRKRRPHPRPRVGRRGDGERRELPRRVLRLAPNDGHRQRRHRHADRRGATRDRRRAGRCGWSTGSSWGSSSYRSSGWSAACGPSAAGAPTHCDARREPCGSGSAWACPSW